MILSKLKDFFSPVNNYADQRSYRRMIMTNFILVAILVSTFIFFFLNIYIAEYTTASMDLMGFVISAYAIYQLKTHHNLEKVSLITTISFTLFFIAFVYLKGNDHFGLIWSIYVPIIAFVLNSKKIGFYVSLTFYIIAYTLAYINIGVWSDGAWTGYDFLRFFFASNILVYMLYMHERSLEISDFTLTEVREKELAYIEQLRQLSITDSLTKLYNRHYFNEFMPKLISLAKRKKQAITFFILDVDSFKAYNDYYGHIAGDKALVAIAETVIKHIQREDDFTFRFGGEEFGGVMLSDTPEETLEHVQQLCSLVEDLKIEHKASPTSKYLTISVGVISVPYQQSLSIEQMYLHADQELYKVKNNGRNHCSHLAIKS